MSNIDTANGGTELMQRGLASKLNSELLNQVQIVASRVRDLDESKIRIWWAHDLPGDPESEFLKNGGWKKFHKLVFVSNWQMQAYINHYNIPWSHCCVIKNAIEPFPEHQKPDGPIRLIYFSTPHRGLQLLVPVFSKLAETNKDIVLDVFSSFELYGWGDRDESFKPLFDACREHPQINYHGSVSNDEIREALKQSHILAYPNIWPETSCLVLIESMAAGLDCVHPNYAALPETAANWTLMYQWNENPEAHANQFYYALQHAIDINRTEEMVMKLKSQATYTNLFYGWNARINEWESLITSLLNMPRAIPEDSKEYFTYRVN